MGQPKPASQPITRRTENVREVVLGFGKKQNLEESRRCPQCAQPSCMGISTGAVHPCPLGVDIPGFIRLLREDNTAGALERIRRDNPFPAVCGRICPAPCEDACIFDEDGAPIAIRSLERYASDFGRVKSRSSFPKASVGNPATSGSPIGTLGGDNFSFKNVAIIGAGPAGMSAAYFLAQAGYGVTLFEAMHEPGGLLRYGVPEFRLPQSILDDQMAELKDMGIQLQINVLVGGNLPLREIMGSKYAAVLLALGAGLPKFIDIPGHNSGGVYYAEEFLMRSQLASKFKATDDGARMVHGSRAVIIGSGPSALDCARLALRLNQEVYLIFGGLEEELDVNGDDLVAAIEEGVKLHAPVHASLIETDGQGFAKAVVGQRLEMVEREHKLCLEPVAGGEEIFEAETVILVAGRRPNAFLAQELPQLKWNNDGTLWTDVQTGLTSMEGIFAAGNISTGAGPVVNAIASGKAAAQKIMTFFNSSKPPL